MEQTNAGHSYISDGKPRGHSIFKEHKKDTK
jgi:hypothetical protein